MARWRAATVERVPSRASSNLLIKSPTATENASLHECNASPLSTAFVPFQSHWSALLISRKRSPCQSSWLSTPSQGCRSSSSSPAT